MTAHRCLRYLRARRNRGAWLCDWRDPGRLGADRGGLWASGEGSATRILDGGRDAAIAPAGTSASMPSPRRGHLPLTKAGGGSGPWRSTPGRSWGASERCRSGLCLQPPSASAIGEVPAIRSRGGGGWAWNVRCIRRVIRPVRVRLGSGVHGSGWRLPGACALAESESGPDFQAFSEAQYPRLAKALLLLTRT